MKRALTLIELHRFVCGQPLVADQRHIRKNGIIIDSRLSYTLPWSNLKMINVEIFIKSTIIVARRLSIYTPTKNDQHSC